MFVGLPQGATTNTEDGMSDAQPGPSMVMELLQRVLTEQGSMRDDMRVLTAIAMRQDNTLARQETTLAAILTEVRAMHSQHSPPDNRVRALEARVSP